MNTLKSLEKALFGEKLIIRDMSTKLLAFMHLKNLPESSEYSFKLDGYYHDLIKQSNTLTELDFLRKLVWGDKRFNKKKITRKLLRLKWKVGTRLTQESYDYLSRSHYYYGTIPMIVDTIEMVESDDQTQQSLYDEITRDVAVIVEPQYYTDNYMVIEHGHITKLHFIEAKTIPYHLKSLASNLQLLSLPNVEYAPFDLLHGWDKYSLRDLHIGYRMREHERSLFTNVEKIHYFRDYSEWRYEVDEEREYLTIKEMKNYRHDLEMMGISL